MKHEMLELAVALIVILCHAKLQSDCYHQNNDTELLQAGCHPTSTVRALKGNTISNCKMKSALCVYIVGCLPAVRDVYEVLTAFVAGMTVEEVCSRLHPRLLGIDERHVFILL